MDTIIAHPPRLTSQNPAGAITPPLLKRQKSSLFNTLSKSDYAPPTQALPLPYSTQDQKVPQHQKATFEVAKWFIEHTIFTKSLGPLLFDEKYLLEHASILAIEAQDRQWTLAGSPVGTQSACQ